MGMFRNRIINGDMRIDQRFSGASHASTTGSTFITDRWVWETGNLSGASWNIQQYGGASLTNGLNNFGGATVGATASVPTNGYLLMSQRIEGYNVADLAWGGANAAPITVSFWAYTSLAGTYAVVLRNNAADRGYSAPFAVTSANTWQYITLCIPGDTTGTWTKDTTTGIYLAISLGCGSIYQVAPRTWAAGNYLGFTGMTNTWSTTPGATFYLTGVQLEKGTLATPFEFRPYPIEMQLCQRYFQNLVNNAVGAGGYQRLCNSVVYSIGSVVGTVTLPATMRATPSGTPTTNCMTLIETWTGGSIASNAAWTMQYSAADFNGSTIALYVSNNTGLSSQAAFLCIKMLNPAGSNYFYVSSEL